MSIKEIFEQMSYGPNVESAAPALDWLAQNQHQFGQFIGGQFTQHAGGFPSINPATGETLAQLSKASDKDIDAAIKAAHAAQSGWWALEGHQRARYLYALARQIQKHARLLAVLETMDNGKPIRESRDVDIPLAHRHFYYHAGLAQLLESEMPGAHPHGVCGQIIPWNFPLLMLSWKIAPALAAGNSVVLKPAENTSLTALLFAQLCQQVGLPSGVVNIITGDGKVGAALTAHPKINKIAFTGSTEVGRAIRTQTAGSGKALTLELGGKSAFMIFEDADLDSAVEGVVDAIWFNQGEVCCAGSRLLLQEPIAERVTEKLRARMKTLRIGDPLDKSMDIGAMVDLDARNRVARLVERAQNARCDHPQGALPENGAFYPPTMLSGLETAHPLWQDEIFGPVLVLSTFRTQDEGIALANNTRYGLAATVWSENVNRALDVASKLAAGVIWINGTNFFDAAAPFGGMRESGFGREGGWEGLSAYLRPVAHEKAQKLKTNAPLPGTPAAVKTTPDDQVDRTVKLFIGGKQARPDGGQTQLIYDKAGKLLGQVPIANRKDLRNAVEAARKATTSWGASSGHLRAQILYYLAENITSRQAEIAQLIDTQTGKNSGTEEVGQAIELLFASAARADKWDGATKNTPLRALSITMHEPVGVICAFCPETQPFLGLLGAMAPAIALGNSVILVASEAFPLATQPLYQLLQTSDMPAGVVNILCGSHSLLAPFAAGHMGIDAIWSFSSAPISQQLEAGSISNLKRTWVNYACSTPGFGQVNALPTFLRAASEVKTVWLPFGDG